MSLSQLTRVVATSEGMSLSPLKSEESRLRMFSTTNLVMFGISRPACSAIAKHVFLSSVSLIPEPENLMGLEAACQMK